MIDFDQDDYVVESTENI